MNLPIEFLERMKQMLGDEFPAFLKSYEDGRVFALRNNTLKCRDTSWNENSRFALSPVDWCSDGFYYEEEDRPGQHPYHEAGLYYIQDASAMAPVGYLDPQPDERVLDLCAAPGGKSTQIAAKMRQQGIFVANEIHPARAKILSENIERMGIRNVLVLNETPEHLAEVFPNYFDRILVDAPCSGEGMFRKNEEACQEWSPENVRLCAARQDGILDAAARMLRPGGRIVYSTCTFAPEEDEGSVARFLERHPEFCAEESIRLWPHRIKGEGHFLAVLRKYEMGAGDESVAGTAAAGSIVGAGVAGSVAGAGVGAAGSVAGTVRTSRGKAIIQKGCKEIEYRDYLEFAKENLKVSWNGIFVRFGEQLYLLPENCPSLSGLKVLRPGLHLGTSKKNRFEPGHALALALSPEEAAHSCDFSADSKEITAYLNGQILNLEGEKGWYLVTVDGYSLGWGKLAGTSLKNHYPKGLRKQ